MFYPVSVLSGSVEAHSNGKVVIL